MGLFNLFSGLTSTSPAAKQFKRLFTECLQLIIDMSYDPNKYTFQTFNSKYVAYMREMAEICERKAQNPQNECFTIYTNGQTTAVRLNLCRALIIAHKHYLSMTNGNRISNTKTDAIINETKQHATMGEYYDIIQRYY